MVMDCKDFVEYVQKEEEKYEYKHQKINLIIWMIMKLENYILKNMV